MLDANPEYFHFKTYRGKEYEAEHRGIVDFSLAKELIPAPTACELGELLPSVINGGKLQITKENDMWDVDYMVSVDYEESYSSLNFWLGPMENTMADAMGLMLIWLKENGRLNK